MFTRFVAVARGSFDSKRFCSRSRNFGIFSNGMFPHFFISQRLKYVAKEHINARLKGDRTSHASTAPNGSFDVLLRVFYTVPIVDVWFVVRFEFGSKCFFNEMILLGNAGEIDIAIETYNRTDHR